MFKTLTRFEDIKISYNLLHVTTESGASNITQLLSFDLCAEQAIWNLRCKPSLVGYNNFLRGRCIVGILCCVHVYIPRFVSVGIGCMVFKNLHLDIGSKYHNI